MNKPSPEFLMIAVFATIIFSFIAFLIALSLAESAYARTHVLQVYHHSFLGLRWSTQEEVTIGMLSTEVILLAVLLPTVIYGVLHPVIGRVLTALSHSLANQLDAVLGLESKIGGWSANGQLMFGAIWPVTMILIPCLLVALLFCHIYKSLWS